MSYREEDRGRIQVAYYDNHYTPAEVAGIFGGMVQENLLSGADIQTVEKWAIHAGHYARLAIAEREEEEASPLFSDFVALTAIAGGVPVPKMGGRS